MTSAAVPTLEGNRCGRHRVILNVIVRPVVHVKQGEVFADLFDRALEVKDVVFVVSDEHCG